MITIILAGGLGTRMKIDYPKVILKVKNIPMIVRSINNAILLKSEMIFIVLNSKTKDQVKRVIQKYVHNKNIFYIIQENPLGTAHALKCCVPLFKKLDLDPFDKILILNADQPLISFYTLNTFIKWQNQNDARVLSCKVNNPSGYGRILRDKKLNFKRIKEEKDCNQEEIKIPYICGGVYMMKVYQIVENIDKLTNDNKQKEFHITDLLNIIKPEIYMLENKFQDELININDLNSLKKINMKFGL